MPMQAEPSGELCKHESAGAWVPLSDEFLTERHRYGDDVKMPTSTRWSRRTDGDRDRPIAPATSRA
jgi:hypothetical protein